MRSSPLSFPSPSSGVSLLSSLRHCLHSLQCVYSCLDSEVGQIWVCSSPNPDAVSFLASSSRAPFTASLKALLEMKAMALPLLASHPPHFLYCKTNRQNKTCCYTSKYWWFGDCSRHLRILDSVLKWKRRCQALDTVP